MELSASPLPLSAFSIPRTQHGFTVPRLIKQTTLGLLAIRYFPFTPRRPVGTTGRLRARTVSSFLSPLSFSLSVSRPFALFIGISIPVRVYRGFLLPRHFGSMVLSRLDGEEEDEQLDLVLFVYPVLRHPVNPHVCFIEVVRLGLEECLGCS